MRNFYVVRDTSTGHKAGEIVSDLHLDRSRIPGMLAGGEIEEIDPAVIAVARKPGGAAVLADALSVEDQRIADLLDALLPDAMQTHEYFAPATQGG